MTSRSTLVRDARPDDARSLSPLLAELGFPASADEVHARLDAMLAAGEIVLVAERDGDVIGLATVHVTPVVHRPTAVGRITALVVAERARREGIGRALVAAAERRVAARGCALIELTSNRQRTAAHAFYERLGYEATSLRFKKSLEPSES
jgi:GNAT superfamily N-acetyltransferase